eukprot:4504577-Pleurochrysis_carterae.AAC.1
MPRAGRWADPMQPHLSRRVARGGGARTPHTASPRRRSQHLVLGPRAYAPACARTPHTACRET